MTASYYVLDMWVKKFPTPHVATPWGTAHAVYEGPGGLRQVSCAGHGGVLVCATLNRVIPAALRNDTRANPAPTTQGAGAYEEDCEFWIPVLCLPGLFPVDYVATARQRVKAEFPDRYAAAFCERVGPGESPQVMERAIRAFYADRFISDAAWGSWADWVPEGFVGLHARRASDGAEAHFLVSRAEYDNRPRYPYPFVINEARHQRVDPGRV